MNDLDEYIALLQQYRPPGSNGGLSVYELAALLEFAGRFAGFAVKPERILDITLFGHERRPEIDCVWTMPDDPDNIVVAWEIDCIDVPNSHLRGAEVQPAIHAHKAAVGNVRKFEGSHAGICVQSLYSYRAGLQLNDRFDGVVHFYQQNCEQVRVIRDTALLQESLAIIIAEAQGQ